METVTNTQQGAIDRFRLVVEKEKGGDTNELLHPEVKQRWLEALRSGRYEQGAGYLNRDGQYCCLGVACDLIDPDRWEQTLRIDPGGAHTHGWPSEQYPELPEEDMFYEVTGLPSSVQSELANLNDSGLTFEQIADLIEEQL